MNKNFLTISILILFIFVCWPIQWYPLSMRLQLSQWFGAEPYQTINSQISSSSTEQNPLLTEQICPEDLLGWREPQVIDGISIQADLQCITDMPDAIAAFVKGTNNISQDVLMRSGLAPDAIEKGEDLDGDGDPDVIHIRLEVVELNGRAPDSEELSAQFAIAPGINPGFWVFAPKTVGMATENFESRQARLMLRMPSPTIRIEQGDRVEITLENSHYMPHTIHFHGVDHPFLDSTGEGNDGVPITSEMPVQPGGARTYNMQPRQTGTMFYHCHVQTQVHAMMGLQGLFVVEENRPNNWLQTLNIGGGLVRAPSQAISESFDREYDLHYLDIDSQLNSIIQRYNDPAIINDQMLRHYNATQGTSEYFTLNGRSFPYTFRESLLITKPNEKIKMRVLNGGSVGISLHTHGHKFTITHNDGVEVNPQAQITRDVLWIAPAQRSDLMLDTTNDGLHSYGSGIWLLHDHQPAGITTDGIGPGGNISAIVYEEFLQDNGWPRTEGEDWTQFFSAAYYSKPVQNWFLAGPDEIIMNFWLLLRLVSVGLAFGVITALLFFISNKRDPS